MKENAKNKMSECLINENSNNCSLPELRHIYEKFIKEVQYNIDNNYRFTNLYKYLAESRYYFEEISDGFYQNIHKQQELFPLNKHSSKKKTFTSGVICE